MSTSGSDDLEIRDKNGRTPLMNAAHAGDIDEVKRRVQSGADMEAVDGEFGYTPLMLACWQGKSEVIDFLIDNGANVNFRTAYNDTPLTEYARHGGVDIVRKMLDKGADIHIAPSNGETVLWKAIESHGWAREEDYEEYRKGDIAPYKKKDFEEYGLLIRLLLDRGANPNVKDTHPAQGWTPLHRAAFEGALTAAEILLQKGADPSILDAKNRTAYRIAKENGHERTAKIIGRDSSEEAALTRGTDGLYPHPKIDLFYKCQCGRECLFHSRDVDFTSGLNVICGFCGAGTYVPPTIFDRSRSHPVDPQGAYIHADWYLRLKPKRP